MGQAWYDCDWDEPVEITELKKSNLLQDTLVFDIGAHHGVVAMILASEVGKNGKVIAVEASGHNAEVARRNSQLNNFSQIEVLHTAVSDRDGTIVINETLNSQLDDGSGSWGRQSVPAMTVDSLAQRYGQPDVVFIDVEGAECLALQGASQSLKSAAAFLIEVHVGCGLEKLGASVEQLLAFFPPDQFAITIRGAEDKSFREPASNDSAFQSRFFLLAQRVRAYARTVAEHLTSNLDAGGRKKYESCLRRLNHSSSEMTRNI
ncbi:MAG: FkbM family methyltransferase [Pirellulales bacterium]